MKILLAIDGSEFTRKAVDYLIAHKDVFGRGAPADRPELACIHVTAPLPARIAHAVSREITDDYYAEQARNATDAALRALAAAGLSASLLTRRGMAGEEIAAAAVQGGFDLIVMGSHGHGAVANLVMGSVATKVLAACKLPVLLVR